MLARLPFPQSSFVVLDYQGIVQLRTALGTSASSIWRTRTSRQTLAETRRTIALRFTSPRCQDAMIRIFHQAHPILSQSNGETPLAVSAAMRALLPNYVTRCFRNGASFFILFDLHPNSIFVDANWRVECLIGLQWTGVRPVEMLLVPMWLTLKRLNQLLPGKDLDTYGVMLEKFFDAFDREQKSMQNSNVSLTTDIMRKVFETGHLRFFNALDNPKWREICCSSIFYWSSLALCVRIVWLDSKDI